VLFCFAFFGVNERYGDFATASAGVAYNFSHTLIESTNTCLLKTTAVLNQIPNASVSAFDQVGVEDEQIVQIQKIELIDSSSR
jgi:hypothetical protein